MFNCLICEKEFDEIGAKAQTEKYEYWGAMISDTKYADCCPHCGSEEFEEKEEDKDDED